MGWIRAQQAVARELEVRLETEPDGVIGHSTDAYRRGRAALDGGGHLQRARAAADRAAALARTTAEAYGAAQLLARIECDAGHHGAELHYARRLMALGPGRRESLEALKHAAVCNGLTGLARRVDGMLENMPVGPGPAADGRGPSPGFADSP
jgi:hypothetical protein